MRAEKGGGATMMNVDSLTLDCHLRLALRVPGFMHVHDFHHFWHANSQSLDNMDQQHCYQRRWGLGMHKKTAPSSFHFDFLTILTMAVIKCCVHFFMYLTQDRFELDKPDRGSE